MQIIQYIITVSVCLSLFYIAYRLFFGKETNFRQLRIYLLGSIALSLALPLNHYRIETELSLQRKAQEEAIITSSATPDLFAGHAIESGSPADNSAANIAGILSDINCFSLAPKFYLMITLLLLARICFQLIILTLQYFKSFKIHHKDCVLLYNHRFTNTFSFFKWIFIQPVSSSNYDMAQIIAHEKVHVSQVHSFDLLVMELLTAVMWFNPLIWMMKNSMQLVHEYLADEGALDTGIDRLRYQALLINQVTEERLICLSSSFNHSLIKKRMIMMTTRKISRKTKLTIITLIPVSISLFFMMAVFNGLFAEKAKATGPEEPEQVINLEKSGFLGAGNTVLPPDTIRKKTIVKIVHDDNPQDTIVKESEEIIVNDDTLKHKYVVTEIDENGKVTHKRYYDDADEDGETRYKTILMHTDKDVDGGHNAVFIHTDEDGITEMKEVHGDSVKIVKVIRKDKGGREEIVTETKQLKIRSTNGKEPSKILYIVDGIPSANKDIFSELDVKQIKSIEVIKDKEIKKYTADNFDGVIIITTNTGKNKE
jgi:hypothetical protein